MPSCVGRLEDAPASSSPPSPSSQMPLPSFKQANLLSPAFPLESPRAGLEGGEWSTILSWQISRMTGQKPRDRRDSVSVRNRGFLEGSQYSWQSYPSPQGSKGSHAGGAGNGFSLPSLFSVDQGEWYPVQEVIWHLSKTPRKAASLHQQM